MCLTIFEEFKVHKNMHTRMLSIWTLENQTTTGFHMVSPLFTALHFDKFLLSKDVHILEGQLTTLNKARDVRNASCTEEI